MPIYEYKCEKCGRIDEYLMRFSDPDPQACTKCAGQVHKLISMSSFSLKGSGWYVSDYGKGQQNHKSTDKHGSCEASGSTPQDAPTSDATPPVGVSSGPSSSATAPSTQSSSAAT